jgi:hypothetical protein
MHEFAATARRSFTTAPISTRASSSRRTAGTLSWKPPTPISARSQRANAPSSSATPAKRALRPLPLPVSAPPTRSASTLSAITKTKRADSARGGRVTLKLASHRRAPPVGAEPGLRTNRSRGTVEGHRHRASGQHSDRQGSNNPRSSPRARRSNRAGYVEGPRPNGGCGNGRRVAGMARVACRQRGCECADSMTPARRGE